MTYENGVPSSDSVNLGSNPSSPATGNADISGVSRTLAPSDKPEIAEQTAHGDRTIVGTAVHYVGFRDERYLTARRIWGGPAFIHRWWDKRAAREIAPGDVVIFADGDWRQDSRRFNAPDITEQEAA